MTKLLNFLRREVGKRLVSSGMQRLAVVLIATLPVDATLVIGVDVTMDPFDDAAIVNAVTLYADQHCGNGDLIYAIGVTGRTFTRPIILAKAQFPEQPGIRNRARREALSNFSRDLLQALSRRDRYPRELLQESHISDFFALSKNLFEISSTRLSDRHMMLISDMLQVDSTRNWETSKEIVSFQLTAVGGTIAIYGVQSKHYRDSDRWNKVRTVWTSMLIGAGVKITSYASILPQ